MMYLSETNLELRVHDHPTDQTCHWVSIFKPLSFLVFRDAQMMQNVVHPSMRRARPIDASDFQGYARWLCEFGGNGLLNLVNVFLRVCELQGGPQVLNAVVDAT